MIIIVLVAAIVFYGVVYVLYAVSQQHISTAEGWLRVLHSMIFLPENIIFMLLRGLILIVAFYVFADWIYSGAKRVKRRKLERKRDAEENELRLRVKTRDQ